MATLRQEKTLPTRGGSQEDHDWLWIAAKLSLEHIHASLDYCDCHLTRIETERRENEGWIKITGHLKDGIQTDFYFYRIVPTHQVRNVTDSKARNTYIHLYITELSLYHKYVLIYNLYMEISSQTPWNLWQTIKYNPTKTQLSMLLTLHLNETKL